MKENEINTLGLLVRITREFGMIRAKMSPKLMQLVHVQIKKNSKKGQ